MPGPLTLNFTLAASNSMKMSVRGWHFGKVIIVWAWGIAVVAFAYGFFDAACGIRRDFTFV